MPLIYSIGKVIVGVPLMTGWRPTVEGLEHIPRTGGAIFAGNHLSVADELFLGAVVPRHLAFWAKSDYFTGTGVKGFLNRKLMEGLGAIRPWLAWPLTIGFLAGGFASESEGPTLSAFLAYLAAAGAS